MNFVCPPAWITRPQAYNLQCYGTCTAQHCCLHPHLAESEGWTTGADALPQKIDQKWTTNGPQMDYKWTTNGPQMDHKWTTDGPQMDHRQKLGEVATKAGGKFVALGCTALLKAHNDGKMEWFESQQWYKKALKMCNSLAAKDDPTAMILGKGQLGHSFGSTKGHSAMELLKTSCKKLAEIPAENPVRQKKWFPNAESMCSTVQSSGPEGLKALLHRQERQAETASGQLLKKTCQEVLASPAPTDDTPVQNWYHVIATVCSKLGTQEMTPGQLEAHCKWLQEAKATGKTELYKDAPWYSRLDKACSWLAEEASFKDHRHHDTADAALVVV